MKPVRVAQIGLGHDHGHQTLQSLCKLTDCFDVVGVYEPDLQRWKGVPQGIRSCSLEELLAMPDLEAVTIETTELEATAYAQLFAERGIAVHLDKPGSPDLKAFRKLIATVQQGNIPFHMGYMYRCNPLVKRTLAMAQSGELGDIFSVEAQMSVRHLPQKRQWLSQFPGGMMFFLGCHLVDLVLQFQGMPEEVIPVNTCTGIDGVTAQDYGFALLRYSNGVSFVKSCASEYNGFDRRQLVVCGSKGTVEIRPWEILLEAGDGQKLSKGKMTLDQTAPNDWADGSVPMEAAPYDRYDDMMRSFARQVRRLETNPCTPDYELKLFETLMRCCGEDII